MSGPMVYMEPLTSQNADMHIHVQDRTYLVHTIVIVNAFPVLAERTYQYNRGGNYHVDIDDGFDAEDVDEMITWAYIEYYGIDPCSPISYVGSGSEEAQVKVILKYAALVQMASYFESRSLEIGMISKLQQTINDLISEDTFIQIVRRYWTSALATPDIRGHFYKVAARRIPRLDSQMQFSSLPSTFLKNLDAEVQRSGADDLRPMIRLEH